MYLYLHFAVQNHLFDLVYLKFQVEELIMLYFIIIILTVKIELFLWDLLNNYNNYKVFCDNNINKSGALVYKQNEN